jgi:hypothetical protein
VLRSCLLMVLVKQRSAWWIAADHNVWRGAAADRSPLDLAFPRAQ